MVPDCLLLILVLILFLLLPNLLSLFDILYVPNITKPLLSIQKFCRDNDCFFESFCLVKDQSTQKILLRGTSELGLYKLCGSIQRSNHDVVVYLVRLESWHSRLGHPNFQTVRQLVNHFHLPCSSTIQQSNVCESCCLGKLHRSSLPSTHNRSHHLLDLIHSDV